MENEWTAKESFWKGKGLHICKARYVNSPGECAQYIVLCVCVNSIDGQSTNKRFTNWNPGERTVLCYLLGVRATTFNGRSTRNDRNILKSKFSWPSTALFSRLRATMEEDEKRDGERDGEEEDHRWIRKVKNTIVTKKSDRSVFRWAGEYFDIHEIVRMQRSMFNCSSK